MSIVLEDHYTGAEINAALARGGEFADAFPGETEGSLDALRELFRRKALVARQARVCQGLLSAGLTAEAIAALRVADLAPGPTPSAAWSCAASSGCPAAPTTPRSWRATAAR